MVTVARANTPFEGHIIKARLMHSEIPAEVVFENGGAIPEITGEFVGGVRVQVPEVFEESALFLLSRDGEEAEDYKA